MTMEFHVLDTGPKKYGDCILCRKGTELILIDGGHPGDQNPRTDDEGRKRAALQDQIAKILKKDPPFKLSLLVVTHAHLDHIGCLPALVAEDIITADWALVADEKFGWGNHVQEDGMDAGSDLPPNARALLAALREDAVPNLSDEAEVAAFLADAASLDKTYATMLRKLKQDGTKIVRYGRESAATLLKAFKGWEMKILGPTKAHMVICADEVRRALSDAAAEIREKLAAENLFDADGPKLTDLYRSLLQNPTLSDAGNSRPGDALNNQSIVLSFGAVGERVLMSGDTQFVLPGFEAIKRQMKALWKKVKDNGEYVLAKTCHHTSHNAFNAQWMEDIGAKAYYVHSGGEKNDTHPDAGALDVLEARAGDVPKKWFRNDRNGLVSFTVKNGKVSVKKQRGKPDDFSPNFKEDESANPEAGGGSEIIPSHPESLETPNLVTQKTSQFVEVSLKIPHVRTRVTVNIEIEPETAKSPDENPDPSQPLARLGGGRPFPRLLAVTDRDRLAANVGAAAADRAIEMLRVAGLDVLASLPPTSDGSAGARTLVRQQLAEAEANNQGYLGVLLIGGHDVVPHVVVDALPAELRSLMRTTRLSHRDLDDYIVWSDHPYGDLDGKGANELPVSRVPDGHSANLLLKALSAKARSPADGAAFGLRNLNRPFADSIYRQLGGSKCLTSAKVSPRHVRGEEIDAHRVYLMLHGNAEDATVFSGEVGEDDDSQIPALDLQSLPAQCDGAVVFSGCCWGALTLDRIALDAGVPKAPRMRDGTNSIALAFLQGGARAFVGCTGSHYSPDEAPYAYFGGPMHGAFWKAMRDPPMLPALALHEARLTYLAGIPHGRQQLSAQAIEHKMFHQFTCLGLGW